MTEIHEAPISPDDIPDWLNRVVTRLSNQENVSPKQATRMVLWQGAMYYEKHWEQERV
jgi:hypothetical protein